MEEKRSRITPDEAEHLGIDTASSFTWGFQRLISDGYFEKARCLVLTAFVYVLASADPVKRNSLLCDISDMYMRLGKIAFEDPEDLYHFLTENHGN